MMIKLFLSNAILNYKRALGSFFKVLLGFFFIACLFSCASQSGVTSTSNFPDKTELPQADLNKKIANSAVLTQVDTFEDIYYLGSGDVIELTVFQVEELNTKVRVNGRGEVILPLLGSVNVEDKSISEVEEIVKEKLQADFLQNPQVSIFISEYRSQQITVMGAVKEPNVYSIRQSRSIFEMLSLAGGLTEVASDKIRVKTVQLDSNTGEQVQKDLILSVRKLLEGAEDASLLRLSGGDSILVPSAGVIFVEGAVTKPGSYVMEGETTVLKAIALAGGVPWSGKEGSVQVIRDIGGEPFAIDVDLNSVRNQRGDDVVLQDGDIIVVDHSVTKRFLTGFFKTAGQIFGYNLNGR